MSFSLKTQLLQSGFKGILHTKSVGIRLSRSAGLSGGSDSFKAAKLNYKYLVVAASQVTGKLVLDSGSALHHIYHQTCFKPSL